MGKENINIKYEHQNNSNYLVIEDNVEYDDYQYKMLRRNKPEHFLRFSMYSVNGRYGIYYDVPPWPLASPLKPGLRGLRPCLAAAGMGWRYS